MTKTILEDADKLLNICWAICVNEGRTDTAKAIEEWQERRKQAADEPREKPTGQFPMDARVRNVWERWEGKVVSSVTLYEIQLDDGTFRFNVHCRDVESAARTTGA